MLTPERNSNIVFVIEGVVVLTLSQIVFAILAGVLHFTFRFVPIVTLALLCSVVATTLTILYLSFRTRCAPIFTVNNKTILYCVSGMIIFWIFHIILSFIFPGKNAPIVEYIKCGHPYKYINFVCFIMLAPIAEEIIYRGYFLKLLLPKDTLNALLITSVLFVTTHLLFHNYGLNLALLVYGIYFFLCSMTYGVVYKQAGLIAAISIHIFNNLHIWVINT